MNIENFMSVARNYSSRAQSDEMIVRNGQDGTASSGKLGSKIRRFFRNLFSVGRDANAEIRRELAHSLSLEYGSTGKIPKNVLQALKIDPDGKMPLDSEGNLKLGSSPLTARRIVAVMDAVNFNRRVAELKRNLTACFGRAAEADEDFAADYENKHKQVKTQMDAIVDTVARKMAQVKPEDFTEANARALIEKEFKAIGYRVHEGGGASFGLTGAAPDKTVMDALVNDLVATCAQSVVRNNDRVAV